MKPSKANSWTAEEKAFFFSRELFRRAANLASNEDLNKILTNTFVILGHMFFRMHNYQVNIFCYKKWLLLLFFFSSFQGKCKYASISNDNQSIDSGLCCSVEYNEFTSRYELKSVQWIDLRYFFSIVDLYHVCADPRLAETNDRVIQINDSLQKDYQTAVGLPEHRHLLTVRYCQNMKWIVFKWICFLFCSGLMVLVRLLIKFINKSLRLLVCFVLFN